MRFKESPETPSPEKVPPGSENKIMHAALRIGETVVMASDGYSTGKPSFTGFGLSITVKDIATADRVFTALSEGGKVTMPLGQTFWSPRFGMLLDRFGVCWMINVMPSQ
jgi:PhnB protein